VCGTCHNPHEQETPEAAFETCASSGCHARADTITVFHRGIAASALANCGSCHKAHSWHADGASCLSCHQGVFDEPPRRGVARTAAATQTASQQGTPLGYTGDLPMSHREHRALECTACHASGGDRHGALTVRTIAQCQECHHTPARVDVACATCHAPAEIRGQQAIATTLRVTSAENRQRDLPFRHEIHTRVACEKCHTPSLAMAPTTSCASCHQEHHQPRSECRACHAAAKAEHTRQAHLGCAGCHDAVKVATLQATRPVCLSCHADMERHFVGRECAQCHQVAWRPGAQAVRGR
jgi:hypothetical protein